MSGSWMTSQLNPRSSVVSSRRPPASSKPRSCLRSSSVEISLWPSPALKQSPAWPEVTRSSSVWSVSAAVGRAKRLSSLGAAGFVRPKIASRSPTSRSSPSPAGSAGRGGPRATGGSRRGVAAVLPASAGAKKKAFIPSALRRSVRGIRPMSPVTWTRALASTLGLPMRIAPERSAASSRYRDRAIVEQVRDDVDDDRDQRTSPVRDRPGSRRCARRARRRRASRPTWPCARPGRPACRPPRRWSSPRRRGGRRG